jgi:hypothetical protein
MSELLDLATIRLDGGTQSRAVTDANTVMNYAYDMEHGQTFPPVVVFHDGASHWLADGFQRYYAAQALELDRILSDIRQGTQRDAILFSCGANAAHGLPRTNEDKRRAVRKLLEDDDWSRESDEWIAEQCRVTARFVALLSEEIDPLSLKRSEIRRAHRGAATYNLNTSNIGRRTSDGGKQSSTSPGFREQEQHPRYLRTVDAMRSIVRAHDALPSPEDAVIDDPHFNAAVAMRVAAWWRQVGLLLQRKAERAS